MPELDLRNSTWNYGMRMDQRDSLKQVYYLLCILWSSKEFDKLGEFHKQLLRLEFQESEINRILIALAVTIRNIWDRDPFQTERNLEGHSVKVGTLTPIVKFRKKTVPLEFREACNKIIHCSSINYDYRKSGARMGDALLPRVHLYGWKVNDNWKATLDIMAFAQLSTLVL